MYTHTAQAEAQRALAAEVAAAEARHVALERQLGDARAAAAAEADSRAAALTVSEALREQLLELSVRFDRVNYFTDFS